MAVLVVVVFLGSITGSSFKVTYGDFEKCNGNGRTDRTDCAIDILNHGNTVKEIEITTGGVTKGICVKSPDKCAAFRGLVAELRKNLIGIDPSLVIDSPAEGSKIIDSFVEKALKLFPNDSDIAALLEDYRSTVKAIINNGILTVKKHVTNDDGGTKNAGDFTIRLSGNNPSVSEFAGSESGTSVILSAGLYGVSELADSSYESFFSSDCNGNIEAQKTKTCIVTNNDIARQPSTTGQ